jgi:predicted DCC family thiol-disulfide oxidoreductase YuxK
MVYDGDCNFCRLWIRRWQYTIGDRADFLPFQDPRVTAQFSEIERKQFETAVQLIMPDGAVYSGAEAVFRSLALHPHQAWLMGWYEQSPMFVRFSDWSYRVVARHRTFFSWLTQLLWGGQVGPPSFLLVRWIFLRLLAIIYLCAFVSLWSQIMGLAGSNGIVPAGDVMKAFQQRSAGWYASMNRYHEFPTLCWFSASDRFLNFLCAAGTMLAVLLLFGIAPAPCLFLLWIIYLSLTVVCDVFLGFQWDNLLLETGFLAIFLAPLQWLPRWPAREAAPSRVVLWLLRWLLIRLMLQSGLVKLLSGDPTWRNLTALTHHYETQPLPTWIGWYAHQLPASFQKFSTAVMFVIELIVPFLGLAPRRPRQVACAAFVSLELLILLTGNYCFFNLLTIALCLLLLDDAALEWWRSWFRKCLLRKSTVPDLKPTDPAAAVAAEDGQGKSLSGPRKFSSIRWPAFVTIPLAVVVLATSFVQFWLMFRRPMMGSDPMIAVYQWTAPFRTFNQYGLFAVMTTSRPEIIIEGSNDGVNWEPYEFKYKPGDPGRRPKFVAPHQPRLDWQMWFAALTSYQRNPWLINFCARLLEGSPQVLALLKRNPFPDAPPRFVRAVLYEYHFTNPAERRATGNWWRRDYKGIYLPPVSEEPGR